MKLGLRCLAFGLMMLATTPAFAFDAPGFCLRIIKGFNNKNYPVDLQSLPKVITMKVGEPLVLDNYFAHGRPSVVGLVSGKKTSLANHQQIAKIAREPKYRKEIIAEYDFYLKHERKLRGHVLPIDEMRMTQQGDPVLLKPFTPDNSLRILIEEKKLTNEQLKSLKEQLRWAEDFYKDTGILLDINPLNFVWVDDPLVLESMGLNRPKFVNYEVTPRGAKVDTLIHKAFLSRVKSYDSPGDFTREDVEAYPAYDGGDEAPELYPAGFQ